MCTLGIVQPQSSGYRLQHCFRGIGHPPAFQPDVVVHAQSGRERNFLTTESWNTATRPNRDPGLLRFHPGTSRAQKITQLLVAT